MKKMLDPKMVFFVAALLITLTPAFAQGMQVTGQLPPTGKESWTDQVKSSFNKFTKSILPEKKAPEIIDELSLSRKAKVSPGLHVALAQSCEQKGQTQNAIIEYEKALKLDPNHENTLLQYAQFCDRINQAPKAELFYDKAVQKHPRKASVFNHQGLFFVRHKRYSEAAQAFSIAVALEPIKESYRGNLAVVLVDLGRHSEAYKQLRAVQSPDTAYYNLGYLLQERGKNELAIKHFQVALRKNPDHQEARIWLAHLQQQQEKPNEMIASRQQAPPMEQRSQTVQPQQIEQRLPEMPVAVQQPQQTTPVADRAPLPSTSEPAVQQKPEPFVQRSRPSMQTPPFSAQPFLQHQASRQPVTQQPVQQWQPQVPPNTTGPVRTHSHYRTTVPPAHKEPYVVPDPGMAGQTAPQAVAPAHVEPPTLIAPAGSTAPTRRLPPTSARRTVNATSDRHITPLPPVDWSDKFKTGQ